jgi:hypothetical protein
MYQTHAALYSVPRPYSIGTFSDLYAWHLLDMLPGIKVWETLGNTKPSITYSGITAGLPVLAFRALVVYGVIAAFKEWLKGITGRQAA